MRTIHYVNLTNGIEALANLSGDCRFVRIQSTACEQHRWDFLLQDLDTDLLLNLALGHHCIVHDYGRHGNPRALWQGCAFIRYVLSRYWLFHEIVPIMRGGQNAAAYFAEQYGYLEDRTWRKLAYFRKFVATDAICLDVAPGMTAHDGCYDWYAAVLQGANS